MNILYRSAFELASAIKSGELTSSEVLEFFLDRVDKVNPRLNIVVAEDRDRARKRATEADVAITKGEDWGPLHGVPITIKDAYATEGIVTVDGIPEYKDFIPEFNADGVQRYVDAGAIVFGKTNVPLNSSDIQSYNVIYGQTNNPWDVSRTCGGSSGGASAALAAGLTPLELGSDIGGSIRTPAHFNGIFGHKPSHGIVSQRGHLPVPESLSEGDLWVPGPLATSVDDLKQAMKLLIGPNEAMAVGWKVDLPPARAENPDQLRVATYFEDPNVVLDVESKALLESTAATLEKIGARVTRDVKPDFDTTENHEVYMRLLTAAMSAGIPPAERAKMEELANNAAPGTNDPEELNAQMATASHTDWIILNERRFRLASQWREFFQDYDVLLCPVAVVPAFSHDHSEPMGKRMIEINGEQRSYWDLLFWAGFSLVSYLPATVAPAGRTRANLPVGVQIVGPYLEDNTCLAVASMLEQHHQAFEAPPGFAD
jgi:amidase